VKSRAAVIPLQCLSGSPVILQHYTNTASAFTGFDENDNNYSNCVLSQGKQGW